MSCSAAPGGVKAAMPRLTASIAEGARVGAGSPAELWKGKGDKTAPGRLSGVEQALPSNASSKNKRNADRSPLTSGKRAGFPWCNVDIFVYGRGLPRHCQVFWPRLSSRRAGRGGDIAKKRHKIPRTYQSLRRGHWRFF